VASGAAAITDDVAHRSEHRLELSDSDQALIDRILAEAESFALEPPSERDWSDSLGISREHLLDLLALLKRDGRMVRAPGDLWFAAGAVAALRERISAHFETNQRLDTKAYKALIGTTRRTAVPLMEYFDDEHLTIRSGDARVLRRR
jgi:selenocysteine-specific elongation factor